jgi:hypothetical protein
VIPQPALRLVTWLGLTVATSSCQYVTVDCTGLSSPALQVAVVDAASGARIAAGATVVATDGSYKDSVVFANDPSRDTLTATLAWDRPGTYAVTARKTGYRAYSTSGVTVKKDRCLLETARVTARLEPGAP